MVSDMRDNQQPPEQGSQPAADDDGAPRVLTPAAHRALAEAEERRQKATSAQDQAAAEVGGRGGPDPVRYGDWEKGGIAWDF